MAKNIGDISNEYEIIKVLGEGGEGTVYKALNKKTNEIVALKRIEYIEYQSENFYKKFKNIKKITSDKDCHRSILCLHRIFTASKDNKTTYWVEFEYLDGFTLFQLEMKEIKINPITAECARIFLIHILEGFDYLNSKGYIHDDLNSANIIFTKNGFKIIDLDALRLKKGKMSNKSDIFDFILDLIYSDYMGDETLEDLKKILQKLKFPKDITTVLIKLNYGSGDTYKQLIDILKKNTIQVKHLLESNYDFSENNYSLIHQWHNERMLDLIKIAATSPSIRTAKRPNLEILSIILSALQTQNLDPKHDCYMTFWLYLRKTFLLSESMT